jgi:hypothetical protein
LQAPALQVSVWVQGLLSLQLPVFGACWQAPALHVSVVQSSASSQLLHAAPFTPHWVNDCALTARQVAPEQQPAQLPPGAQAQAPFTQSSPLPHAAPVPPHTHLEATHWLVVEEGQAAKQAPQCLKLVARSAHSEPQAVSPVGQPASGTLKISGLRVSRAWSATGPSGRSGPSGAIVG